MDTEPEPSAPRDPMDSIAHGDQVPEFGESAAPRGPFLVLALAVLAGVLFVLFRYVL